MRRRSPEWQRRVAAQQADDARWKPGDTVRVDGGEGTVLGPCESPYYPPEWLEVRTPWGVLKRPPEALRAAYAGPTAAEWNARHPVGTPVEVTLWRRQDGSAGEIVRTRTRSEAWTPGPEPLVLVEGKTGGYALDFVSPLGDRGRCVRCTRAAHPGECEAVALGFASLTGTSLHAPDVRAGGAPQ